MTALSVVPSEEAPAAASRVTQVTRALANSRDKLEAPFRLIPEVNRWALTFGHIITPKPGSLGALHYAQRWLADAPSWAEMNATRDALAEAFNAPANREMARVTLGLLLSAFPNAGKEPKDEYYATLLHDVVDEGIGPHVLAEACRHLRRSTKFLPTIGEVVAACENAKYRLDMGIRELDRHIAMTEASENVVAVHAKPANEWPNDAWLEAVLEWGRFQPWNDALGPEPGVSGCLIPLEVIALYRAMHGRYGRMGEAPEGEALKTTGVK